jgi:hypothetical protein
MKKVILIFLAILFVGIIPAHFADTGGNLRPVATFNPINTDKGEQK